MASRIERLRRSIERDERYLRPFRENRVEMVKAYCGTDYGPLTEDRPIYLPVFHQAADTYTQVLVADRPRALVTSQYKEFKWFAKHFERALNNHIKEIRLESELRMCVLEAFFCMGVMKVYYGEDKPQLLEGSDVYVDPGRPYAEHVSLDNFGFDTAASDWRKIQYAYDRYSVAKEDLLDDPRYSHAAEAIKAATDKRRPSDEDSDGASMIGSNEDDPTSFIEMVSVMDVWIPRENKIITMLSECGEYSGGAESTVLREIEWEGPENGPYHILSFSDVPDNIVGVSPGMKLRRLGDLLNSLYRKQVNQARRQRDLPIYEGDAEGDVTRLRSAADGQWTRVRNRESVGVMKMGGVDPANQQFSIAVLDMFDRMAGNLQAMAGLGAQADTLGQDQIIQQQSSRLQAKMQQRVVEFTANIMRDLGWLLWNDQAREIATEYEIPGTGIMARSTWTPEHREGKFIHYNFEIEPYSMQYKSPSQRANGLLTYVNSVAAPMLQLIMQQGGQIDFKQLTDYWAELMDLPRLKDCVVFQENGSSQLGPQPEAPPGGKPAQTTRTHVRQNVSTGGTPQNRSNEMQQALSSLAQQQGNGQVMQGAM